MRLRISRALGAPVPPPAFGLVTPVAPHCFRRSLLPDLLLASRNSPPGRVNALWRAGFDQLVLFDAPNLTWATILTRALNTAPASASSATRTHARRTIHANVFHQALSCS